MPRTVLELGTGWHAVFPVAMFLAGVDEIWTWDIARLLERHRLQRTLNHFLSRAWDNRMSAFRLVASPHCVMSHEIDTSDQYASFDLRADCC